MEPPTPTPWALPAPKGTAWRSACPLFLLPPVFLLHGAKSPRNWESLANPAGPSYQLTLLGCVRITGEHDTMLNTGAKITTAQAWRWFCVNEVTAGCHQEEPRLECQTHLSCSSHSVISNSAWGQMTSCLQALVPTCKADTWQYQPQRVTVRMRPGRPLQKDLAQCLMQRRCSVNVSF